MTSLLEVALVYARGGLAVFPLVGKLPDTTQCPHAVKDASSDPDRVGRWQWKERGAGMACGIRSGRAVLDFDFPERFEMPLPDRGVVDTNPALGKIHLHVAIPPGVTIPSRTREPVPGVESIRSDGYYVVLPPSRHPDGHRYRWRAPSWEAARLDELHPDLAEAILRPKKRHEPRDLRPVLPPPKGSWTPYGRAALAGCLKDILEAPEGLRHDTILATTLRLAALSKAGHLEWDLACRLVREAAARAGLHDRLRQAEVERLLRGAWDLAAPAEVR